jgi:hypothetical protein
MDFEQMQLVWDREKSRTLYALDLDALHASVRKRGRRIAAGVEAMEIGMIAISIFLAGFLVSEPLLRGDDPQQYASAAVLLGVAAYLLVGRRRRRERERGFASNLRGDLERAIAQVDYHLQRVRTVHWWFFLPSFLTIVIGQAFEDEIVSTWLWLPVLAAFPFGLWVARQELRCHLSRKRDLESLRAKLVDEP